MATTVEKCSELQAADLGDLCSATDDAIKDGIGFYWVSPPAREKMESYWKGVLMVPDRELFVGRLDGTICAAIQLVRPSKTRETSAFACTIEAHFVAPWARSHGLAKELLEAAEHAAAKEGFSSVRISVRETQTQAVKLYRESGYIEWGVLPYYEFVNASMVAGHFFYKPLRPVSGLE